MTHNGTGNGDAGSRFHPCRAAGRFGDGFLLCLCAGSGSVPVAFGMHQTAAFCGHAAGWHLVQAREELRTGHALGIFTFSSPDIADGQQADGAPDRGTICGDDGIFAIFQNFRGDVRLSGHCL